MHAKVPEETVKVNINKAVFSKPRRISLSLDVHCAAACPPLSAVATRSQFTADVSLPSTGADQPKTSAGADNHIHCAPDSD